MEADEVVAERWGTWEELLLGGAVLRHGTRDWDVVAAELRARTVSPFTFTPEVCKAKYEDLQQRYCGCIALYEELRKQRMAELRKVIEQSEDSIGSLESKLEILKAESGQECNNNYDSSQTESDIPFQKSEGIESSSKEASKDGLSAGSFTQETRINWSSERQLPASTSAEEIRQEISMSPQQEKVSSTGNLGDTFGFGIRRRRGKRKRRYCGKNVKEGSVGESDVLGSAGVLSATRCKENSITSSSGQVPGSSGLNKESNIDLMQIFDSISENKCASVFHRRLDGQKRGRYKKMILQHRDFDTIRSQIVNQTIKSAREVFRDLLLLANNALVFYSKTTREYKSAFLLRGIVTKSLRQHLKDSFNKTTNILLSAASPLINPPGKPRSAHPGNCKLSGKMTKAGNVVAKTSSTTKRLSNAHSPPAVESPATKKKSSGRPRKAGHGNTTNTGRHENPTVGRKRIRTK